MEAKSNNINISVTRYKQGNACKTCDIAVIEEPLEIYLDGERYYLTMRTPGDEIFLALGYCFSQGIIASAGDVSRIDYCREQTGNKIEIQLQPGKKNEYEIIPKLKNLPAYSSCGICGQEMVEDSNLELLERDVTFFLDNNGINKMLDDLERAQELFKMTGGAHAAALFNRNTEMIAFAEDIGRHNAVDKALGKLVFAEKLKDVTVILLTSRLSFEMVQKAGRTGAEILIGMSTATSLGIELARKTNLTLIGFADRDRGNIYTGEERIKL